ncbi:DapH/DapD/GlmU-related protein [Microbacterium sp. SORGH_AS_0862]|uniref:acyltransferase n=1 Tax=Microbacterium sp. SORGH_AS_0862 TaxID=3041789 RepID=UPI002793FC98|nr:acyltransferase [Microbacterium sp. SORGH_AS_0862]MDQ1205651.1 acetyltransferase-like isoleucine patch superfamily enzyme [Microbacterium sp. SORGH_AS_0862]
MQVSNVWWRAITRVFYYPRFASHGRRGVIRRPIALLNPGGITVGDNLFVREGARIEAVVRKGVPRGRIVIGNNVSIEQGAHIAASGTIIIEDDVAIAPRGTIIASTHPIGDPADGNRASHVELEHSVVHIKRRVLLGANVVVLPNVTIGENSVIGAGSVVTRDIPPNSVAVGSPAIVIRTFG